MSADRKTDGDLTAHINRHAVVIHDMVVALAMGDGDETQDRGVMLGQAMLTLSSAMLRLCMDSNRPQALLAVLLAVLKDTNVPAEHVPPPFARTSSPRSKIVGG